MVGGAQAAEAATAYAVLLFGLGAVPAWLANTLASVLRGGGRHGLAARVLTLAWLLYPPLAWALMEPAGMGLSGAGLAFALAMIAAAAAMAVVVWRGGAGFTPSLRAKPSAALFRRILSVGLVASALASVANLTTILVTAQIAAYGTAAVAAYGISARIEFLLIPLVFGVGSALTALVGRAVGEGDWASARRIAWTGAALSVGLAALLGLPAGLAPGATARAFTDDPAVAAVAARALAYIGPGLIGFGVGMALYFASMGAGPHARPGARGVLAHRDRGRRRLAPRASVRHGARRLFPGRGARHHHLRGVDRSIGAARRVARPELMRFPPRLRSSCAGS